jgi:hypothetical protein
MSTWEERMSGRAQERIRAERDREEAERERQEAEWEAAAEAHAMVVSRAEYEAGPPCPDCYRWALHYYYPGVGHWRHVEPAVTPGPAPPSPSYMKYRDTAEANWCHHGCHGAEPCYTVPPAMAAV